VDGGEHPPIGVYDIQTIKPVRAVTIETVKIARDWLREQMGKGWEVSGKFARNLFNDAHAFNVAKGHGVGRDLILKFLGGSWKEWDMSDGAVRPQPII
jgi:hypothetical protein